MGAGDRLVVCGAGCGGPMSAGGDEVSPLNIEAWRGFPLRARRAELTGLATFVDNDAKALALGEGWIGAAAGCADFLAMVVSTGVGGGIVLNGRLLDGRLGNAGHIGHVVVEPSGRACPCGGAAASKRKHRGRRSLLLRAARRVKRIRIWSSVSGPWSGTRSRRSRTCWTCPWPLLAVRWRSGTALRSSPRHRRRWIFAAGSTSPGAPRVVPGGLGGRGPARRCGAGRAGPSGAGGVSGGQGRGQWGRDGLVVVRAVLPHPGLWWVALAALWRLARRGWWRRPPFLPVPGDAYWRFRLVTVNGGDGISEPLQPADVVAYLRWCQRSRPQGG